MKDHRSIDKAKIEKFFVDVDLNLTVGTKFTKETAAHFCCKNGHHEILKKILTRSPEAANNLDDMGNTLLHALINVRTKTSYKV